MNDYKLDLEKYATLARQAAAEGCVLLENEKQALPLREGESVAVFGRMAFHYYKSGLGSGGLVNTRYVVGILDALKECKEIQLDEKLLGVLNVGNIIDMSWVEKYHPQAVLYAWQGGQEGGNGVADVLTGKVCACGKLTDTIAERIEYYPSTENFGDPYKNYYKEDIYVGYRYFETFAKDKVLYPFGYGLSYTNFETKAEIFKNTEDELTVAATVTNIGDVRGKEVVQVYVKAPQGKLGNPARKLIGFAKTRELAPGEKEELVIIIPKYDMASYDDSGVTGHKSCYVLEEGTYEIFAGVPRSLLELQLHLAV